MGTMRKNNNSRNKKNTDRRKIQLLDCRKEKHFSDHSSILSFNNFARYKIHWIHGESIGRAFSTAGSRHARISILVTGCHNNNALLLSQLPLCRFLILHFVYTQFFHSLLRFQCLMRAGIKRECNPHKAILVDLDFSQFWFFRF